MTSHGRHVDTFHPVLLYNKVERGKRNEEGRMMMGRGRNDREGSRGEDREEIKGLRGGGEGGRD